MRNATLSFAIPTLSDRVCRAVECRAVSRKISGNGRYTRLRKLWLLGPTSVDFERNSRKPLDIGEVS